MRNIVIHDTRLHGPTPEGPNITPVGVNETTLLSTMVSRAANAATRLGTDVRLNILCHGYETDGDLTLAQGTKL
jgi:hypothetical protein